MSAQKETLFLSFFLILFIAILHSEALSRSLYWTTSWLDLLMHFLMGFWVTITLLWFLFLSSFSSFVKIKMTRKNVLVIAVVVFLIAALSWEIFELITIKTIDEPNFLTDTISDTIIGLVGLFLAYKYFVHIHMKS